ncbi:MAG: ATP-binding protein [Candidatus Methanoperedens sp.]|nr:ATP-binding protein [Candidatus Methanoperedens sp.]
MVKASLKKVFIKNFKSLHDCEIDIGKLNVVVGANASGKSNLVEAFRLLKKIYADKDSFPFLEWWGYNNVVWQRKEELSITIGLLFNIEGYDVYFEIVCTGAGGKFQILREVLDVRGYVRFEKEGELNIIIHNPDFIDDFIKNPLKYEASTKARAKLKKLKSQLTKEIGYEVDLEKKLLEYSFINLSVGDDFTEKKTGKRFILSNFPPSIWSSQISKKPEEITVLCPAIYYEGEFEDSNIASVYHTIYLKEGKIPEQIYNPLTMVFPKIDVRPHLTDDGRVMIKFLEDGFDLLPPNTSDGFYKILTLLTAIYLNPPLLIIDEIENSLHPSTLELILDTIKIGDTQTIITTHSPVVVDMTDLSNIVLVEKEQGESKFKRIKDPEKIKEFLIEKGITFSEGWIYGDLFKTEQQA